MYRIQTITLLMALSVPLTNPSIDSIRISDSQITQVQAITKAIQFTGFDQSVHFERDNSYPKCVAVNLETMSRIKIEVAADPVPAWEVTFQNVALVQTSARGSGTSCPRDYKVYISRNTGEFVKLISPFGASQSPEEEHPWEFLEKGTMLPGAERRRITSNPPAAPFFKAVQDTLIGNLSVAQEIEAEYFVTNDGAGSGRGIWCVYIKSFDGPGVTSGGVKWGVRKIHLWIIDGSDGAIVDHKAAIQGLPPGVFSR